MRGLESTCTVPWDSRKASSAAKFFVAKARPNSAPPGSPEISAPAVPVAIDVEPG